MIPCIHGCGQQFETAAFAKRHVKYCRSGPNARNLNRTLDCAYCPEGSGEFKDFRELAEHVLRWHVQSWAPAATLDDVDKMLRENLKGETKMPLKAPTAQAQGASNDFIKAEHFNGKEKGKLVLLGGRIPNGTSSFSDIFLDVKLGKLALTWGLKADSRNYAFLYKRFGADEKKWKGTVDVVIAKGKYINVIGS